MNQPATIRRYVRRPFHRKALTASQIAEKDGYSKIDKTLRPLPIGAVHRCNDCGGLVKFEICWCCRVKGLSGKTR